jgi:preprotein translocase subunit SecF
MFDIVGKRYWLLSISGVMLIACIIFMAVFGLKAGVEFSSGSVMTVSSEKQVEKEDLKTELAKMGYDNVIIQEVGDTELLVRLPRLTPEEKTNLETDLTGAFETMTISEFDDVSEMIASETTRNAGIAIAISTVGILLYLAWAFRKMPHPFHYGVCAILALVHDSVIAFGIFAVLGRIFGWQIDLNLIIAILTIIGYSVNNTVVVFDRMRENFPNHPKASFGNIVNMSIIETLTRSINTSVTTVFGVVALMCFVGTALQNFTVVLLIGLVAGTYSANILAPLILVVWQGSQRKTDA